MAEKKEIISLDKGLFGLGWVPTAALLAVFLFMVVPIANNAGVWPKELAFLSLNIGSPAVGDVQTGTANIESLPVSTQVTVTTVDLSSSVKESQKDTTGVNTQTPGSLAWYYEGETTPFETTSLTSTAAASSTNDARPNSKVIAVFTNTSFYTTLFAQDVSGGVVTPYEVPYSPSMTFTGLADRLNTISIQCQNTSDGSWQASGMKQALTTDEAKTLTCKLIGGTARGVFRAPMVMGLDFSTTADAANFSSTGTYPVNGVSTDARTTTQFSGYDVIKQMPLASLTDFNEQTFQIRIEPASGVNPDANITLKVADCGATYTKSIWPIVFSGCENGDTGAAVGATDATFVIDVD